MSEAFGVPIFRKLPRHGSALAGGTKVADAFVKQEDRKLATEMQSL